MGKEKVRYEQVCREVNGIINLFFPSLNLSPIDVARLRRILYEEDIPSVGERNGRSLDLLGS